MARRVRLHFYGRLREDAGGAMREAEIPDHIQTTDDLVEWLAAENNALGEALRHPSVRAAAGDAIILRGADIRQAAEIAFLPPFSGG